MKIEITRGQKIYENKPESVTILLIDDDGNSKAAIHIYPQIGSKHDTFRLVVSAGNVSVKPPLLFEVDI